MMIQDRFAGKVMVVTGGTSGIGKAVCLRAGAEGAKVVIAGRNQARGEAIEKEIREAGGEAVFIQCDVTRKEDIINLYARTVEIYGRLDIAINNAGIVGDSKKIEDLTDDDWFSVVNANLNAMFYCIREEIKYTHANIAYDQLRALMHNTKMLARDLGTVLVGQEAVDAGLINEVGGIREALKKLYEMIDESCAKKQGF